MPVALLDASSTIQPSAVDGSPIQSCFASESSRIWFRRKINKLLGIEFNIDIHWLSNSPTETVEYRGRNMMAPCIIDLEISSASNDERDWD